MIAGNYPITDAYIYLVNGSGLTFYETGDSPLRERKWLGKRHSNLLNRPQPEIQLSEPVSFFDWYRDKEFLHQEYVLNQRSTSQIAKSVGCARSTVVQALLEFDIPLRDYMPSHYRKGQVAFGEKIHGGRIVPHKGELKIVSNLLAMRTNGASYGTLTKWLNGQGIKTKNGVKQWDRPTVYKILKRYEDYLNPS